MLVDVNLKQLEVPTDLIMRCVRVFAAIWRKWKEKVCL